MFTNSREVEIEWGDCDAAGIVYYPRYFAFFDNATAHLMEAALGMKKKALTRHYGILGIPMVDTGASFSVPFTYGDVIRIDSAITRVGRSSFEVGHTVVKHGKTAIAAHEKRVWVGGDPADPASIGAVPIPAEVVEKLTAKGT